MSSSSAYELGSLQTFSEAKKRLLSASSKSLSNERYIMNSLRVASTDTLRSLAGRERGSACSCGYSSQKRLSLVSKALALFLLLYYSNISSTWSRFSSIHFSADSSNETSLCSYSYIISSKSSTSILHLDIISYASGCLSSSP